MSLKADILASVKTRLTSISEANGYSLSPKEVYVDEIPMGIQLNEYQLPAILLMEGVDTPTTQHRRVDGLMNIIIQLWHNRVGDVIMSNYVRDCFKAIYANSPTAEKEDEFRTIHPKVVEFIPLRITPDLNMIEANRVTELSFNIRYSSRLYDL